MRQMAPSDTSHLSFIAIQAALKAGGILKRGFHTSYAINSKEGKHNLVTEYDTLSEEIIISMIRSYYPDHAFLAEESGLSASKQQKTITWIIDPLDGTVNFAHKVPIFSVSIAAAFDNDILCGVVYQPMTEELFVAEKGKGAFLNGSLIQVSPQTKLEDSYVATGFPYNVHENPLYCIDSFAKLSKMGLPIRRLGSAAIDLSYVAAGRFDAYWEVFLQPWDLAAGKLIVEEAGGKVSNYFGEERKVLEATHVLATNGHLHKSFIEKLATKDKS